MLTEKEIKPILDGIIPELKKIDNAERQKKKAEPVFYPSYPIITDYAERISVHAEIGKFPAKLFANRSPNQEEKEWEYVKNNYKQVTLPVFVDYMSTITRPFHDANWSIDYEEDESKFKEELGFQNYVENGIKIYGSIENFVKFIVNQRKAVDAEGIIAVKPHSILTKTDEQGETIVDPDRLAEPVPVYYASKKIVAWKLDEYAMVMLDEKSNVDYGGVQKKMGYVFEFYDRDKIWRIEQSGKFIDYDFTIAVYFEHEWNRVPCFKLMGIPQIIEDSIIWQSPFLYATDLLDLVALNSSNKQMSINTCVYPYRVMIGDVCEWKDRDGNQCSGGKIIDKDNIEKTCGGCGGSSLRSRISPLGTMLLKPKTRLEDGDSTFTQAPLSYVSPQVTTLEFLDHTIDKDTEKARKILHLQTSNSVVKGTENLTATGMAIDVKALYAFVKTITDQTFYLWECIFEAIGYMRYAESFKMPKFTYPTSFDFVTEADIIDQLKAAVDGGLPPMVINSIIHRYLQTLYFHDQKTASIFTLIVKTDRLLSLSNEEIALKLARGTVHDWEEILHTSAVTLVDELIDEDPNFLNQELNIKKEKLIAKAKSIPCNSGECKIGEDQSAQEGINSMVSDLTNTAQNGAVAS